MRTLVLERREHVGGAAETAELGGVRVPRLAHTVGRLRPSVVKRPRPPLARPAPRRAGRPRLRAAAGRPRDHALGATRAGRSPACGTWSGARRRRVPRLRPPRPLARAGSSPTSRRETPPDIKAPGIGDALTGLQARADVPRPRQARLAHDPAGPADGRRRLRRRGVRDRRAAGGDRLARRPLSRSLGPWSAGTTAILLADGAGNDGGAAGQTVFAIGGPGRAVRGAGGRGARGRRRDPQRRRGRRDHARATAA